MEAGTPRKEGGEQEAKENGYTAHMCDVMVLRAQALSG